MPRVFSVGECPACPGSGSVLALAKRMTPGLVFYCPACGCAWAAPPQQSLDEVNALQDLAPGGVRLPEPAEVEALGGRATEVEFESWEWDLVDLLGPADA